MYPHKFNVSMSVPQLIVSYSSLEKNVQLRDSKISIAGRIMAIRKAGSKLRFYDLQADGTSVQVVANQKLRVVLSLLLSSLCSLSPYSDSLLPSPGGARCSVTSVLSSLPLFEVVWARSRPRIACDSLSLSHFFTHPKTETTQTQRASPKCTISSDEEISSVLTVSLEKHERENSLYSPQMSNYYPHA